MAANPHPTRRSRTGRRQATILRLFVAGGSRPSDAMRSLLGEVLKEHDDINSFVVEEVDAWEEPQSVVDNSVLTLPTLVVLSGDREVARLTGLRSSRSISEAIGATAPDRRGNRRMHLVLAILGGVLMMAACGGEASVSEASTTVIATSTTQADVVPPETTTTVQKTTTTTTVEEMPTGPETVPLVVLDDSSQPSLLDVTADGGGAPEAPDTLLFRKLGDTYVPLLAPDGHQLTRAEWATAEGKATITCEEGGTRYDLEFSGLIPDGVYTIWHFPTTEPVTRNQSGEIENPMGSAKFIDSGALGLQNGDENAFTADAEGNAALNVLVTKQGARDPVPECTLVGGTYLVVLYHIDNQTWGSQPGPEETIASHAVFIYPRLGLTFGELIGTWRCSRCGSFLVLNEDGTYRITFSLEDVEGRTVEQGEFTLEGTLFTFISNEDSSNCAEGQRGTYEMEVLEEGPSGRDRVKQIQVSDECTTRGSVGDVTLERVPEE